METVFRWGGGEALRRSGKRAWGQRDQQCLGVEQKDVPRSKESSASRRAGVPWWRGASH